MFAFESRGKHGNIRHPCDHFPITGIKVGDRVIIRSFQCNSLGIAFRRVVRGLHRNAGHECKADGLSHDEAGR